MNSPLALFLAGAGGICLLVGGWYSTAGIKEPERWQSVALRLFGAACLGLPATVIVLNLASPTTMHFSDLIEVGGVALPWGERLTQATAIPSRGPVESTAGGRARLSYRHHRSRTPRSTASLGVTRGRVRVFRFRNRAGIRAAARPRGRPLRKMSQRFF
ncbi:MAG: hypothetical protein IIC36_01205 [Gemmatimonadetes bacterium]|nr:hypothetical protein [Gemmatimonadota bacterium]